MLVLESHGVKVDLSDGTSMLMTAKLSVALGDIPACTDLSGHIGHTGIFGCRLCPVEAITYKRGHYYMQAKPLRSMTDYSGIDKVFTYSHPPPIRSYSSFLNNLFVENRIDKKNSVNTFEEFPWTFLLGFRRDAPLGCKCCQQNLVFDQ